jgi:hypothetical protein
MARPKRSDIPADLTGDEREKLRKRQWYLQKREEQKKKREQWNRAQGHKPPENKTGHHDRPRVKVTKERRFVIIAGKVYFNSELGYEPADLRAILEELRAACKERTSQVEQEAAELAKQLAAKQAELERLKAA